MSHHGSSGKGSIPPGNQSSGGAKQASADGAAIQSGQVTGAAPQEVEAEANRPISAGSGKLRGDRRDTQPDPGTRDNHGLRNDRNPTSKAGRQHNSAPNEGG